MRSDSVQTHDLLLNADHSIISTKTDSHSSLLADNHHRHYCHHDHHDGIIRCPHHVALPDSDWNPPDNNMTNSYQVIVCQMRKFQSTCFTSYSTVWFSSVTIGKVIALSLSFLQSAFFLSSIRSRVSYSSGRLPKNPTKIIITVNWIVLSVMSDQHVFHLHLFEDTKYEPLFDCSIRAYIYLAHVSQMALKNSRYVYMPSGCRLSTEK